MKKWKIVGILLVLTLMLAACSSNGENDQTSASDEGAAQSNTSGEQTSNNGSDEGEEENSAFPMTISSTTSETETQDGATYVFEDVTFEKMPEKIAVFDYGFLDTLDALGVEGIAGVSKGSSFPSNVEKYNTDEYANLGSLKGPLFEDIAELQPDVIFISGRQSAFYEELKEIAPVVFVGTQQDDYWNSFLASVNIAAQLFDKEAEAEKYIAQIDSALEEINSLAGEFDTTLVTMYNEGSLSGFSTNSRFGYIYDIYGFQPVTEDIESSSHGSNFGFEAIFEFDPDVLFVIDRTAAIGGDSNIAADMENDIMTRTTAYENERIIYLDGGLFYLSGGGLQSELAKIEEIIAELK